MHNAMVPDLVIEWIFFYVLKMSPLHPFIVELYADIKSHYTDFKIYTF